MGAVCVRLWWYRVFLLFDWSRLHSAHRCPGEPERWAAAAQGAERKVITRGKCRLEKREQRENKGRARAAGGFTPGPSTESEEHGGLTVCPGIGPVFNEAPPGLTLSDGEGSLNSNNPAWHQSIFYFIKEAAALLPGP
ncbi:unnamed protein product [Pleuronectes platessa]|uniref:Uncharacterized protein n=1 Tax=Pleuronectes platessa TaxID=8262 RepID=A0A9N7TNU1_PLEPL|nr:unnamed protein product [Pleuronectes platessa]